MNRPPGEGQPDLSAIYREHRAGLKGYVSKRVKAREEVEDIVQDVFYHLARLDPVSQPVEKISAWLHAVARNRIIDRGRKRKEERLPARDDDDPLAEISDILRAEEDDPLSSLLKSLFWEELQRALEELPAAQRSVFELTELEGFSFKEIAGTTGIPLNTLLSRKHHAILHLRERLRGLYREIMEG
jgi:RNA polymerase sigma factor (sigma-70 family)